MLVAEELSWITIYSLCLFCIYVVAISMYEQFASNVIRFPYKNMFSKSLFGPLEAS